MSTVSDAKSMNNHTGSSSESDKIQSAAPNEVSSSTITRNVGLEEKDNKKEESFKMKIDTSSADASITGSSRMMTIPESASDFNQWLRSMLDVARLPGGLPIEFRRKLWLALAERHLRKRNVNWDVEKVKWLSDKCRADDDELGIQIVKDLHRTGHSLLSGASGQIYQAKLKKVLIGYTRWNPEVGYCQGFNMLGAIILQVMDKCEVDSIKVMIFLIEGLLPKGYFCGGLLGLQADMAVFRELLGYKLPKLARHLQKLQGSTGEPSFEPPIINVFTMQWFLTLFCNCLPMSYVLRIWDLIMIEGSDILLRTALSIWKVLEDRILGEVKTADDFYCKMESLSAELLSGSLIDSNRLVHMISTLGPISELQRLRQKHLVASYNDQKKLKMLYSNAENESVTNAWAKRRGSQPRLQTDREKIALDITILKKQYDKLKERQRQAHVILSSAVTKQNQQKNDAGPSSVNKLLVGKNAIISKNRKGPPKGAIPPVRNQKVVKSSKTQPKPTSQQETVQWSNVDDAKKRRNSLTWKEINADRRTDEVKTMSKSSSASSLGSSGNKPELKSPRHRSDSSSYSEDSDCESSPSTSLCDEDVASSSEPSPMKKKKHKETPVDVSKKTLNIIEETSPITSETKTFPEITVRCPELEFKIPSPIPNFYLDLPSNFGACGDITSISQLSPMPDLSSYFTAISPIKTPCDYFEFPDLSGLLMTSEEKFQVNEDGVTNEFFERVFEENLSTSAICTSPQISTSCNNASMSNTPDNSVMSKSYSPTFLKEEAADKCRDSLKYIKQKSLSMDEQSHDKDEVISINRSFSDGTIIKDDIKIEDFQKIIAENTKILNNLTPRGDNVLEIKNQSKHNIEPVIMEESKSPNNLSDIEEEIAAIDKPDSAEDEHMLSDIQDLANMDNFLTERKNLNETSSTCNTYTKDENVIEKNEKSIRDENETVATLACSPLENKSLEAREKSEVKALAVTDVKPNVEARRIEEKVESPKFNEIQLMVTKLKEEMESELKISEVKVEEKSHDQVTDVAKGDNKVNKDARSEMIRKVEVKIIVENVDEIVKTPEKTTVTLTQEAAAEDPPKVKNEQKKPEESKPVSENEQKPEQNTTKPSDLEKTASESVQKIDKNDSDTILHKLNTQLEKCQKAQTQEVLKLDNEKTVASNKSADTRFSYEEKQTDVENLEVKSKRNSRPLSPEVEASKAERSSSDILEKLNMQLQKCEVTRKSDVTREYHVVKSTAYETSAVMELAELIKERELEKLSELKMKSSKELDFEVNLSPLRSSRSRSNISSPVDTGRQEKFNSYVYDHEPRSELRRRDIITLETEQRIRRPFKSSPTNSLSSSPSNISDTLSSIKNTIKILDSACQKTDVVANNKVANNYSKYDKAMESVEKICDSNRDWQNSRKNQSPLRSRYETSPSSYKLDDSTFESLQPKRLTVSDDKGFDRNFDLSPRKNRYDFDDGANLRSSRNVSPRVSPSRFTSKTPDVDPEYISKLRYLSTEEYIAGRKSPLNGSREGLDTKFKMDRSPTSPVLSTHFSRSPKSPRSPRSPSHNSYLLKFPSDSRQSSKSAENSPSRYSSERVENNYKYNSSSGSIDMKAESMSNLSYKPSKKYEFEWEKDKPLSSKKYDFF